jgi:hypothetical protein
MGISNILGVLFLLKSLSSRHSDERRLTSVDWSLLRLNFDPAIPNQSTTLSLTLSPTVTLPSASRLVVYLPGISFLSNLDAGHVEFNFLFQQGRDANLLNYYAQWFPSNTTLVFVLASDFTPGTAIVISMVPGSFILPASSPQDSPMYTIQVSNADGSRVLVPETSFTQSTPVYASISFLTSSAVVTSGSVLGFNFSLTRGVFAGDKLDLQLPGYAAHSSIVPIVYSSDSGLFAGNTAVFEPSNFTFTFEFARPRSFDGSGTDSAAISLPSLSLPRGQSQDDKSLRVSIRPWSPQPIKNSPAFGVKKEFLLSSLWFEPTIPSAATAINVSFIPSVELYAGSVVLLHLRGGFSRSINSSSVSIYGNASEIFGGSGNWNGSAISLTVQPGSFVPVTRQTSLWIPVSEGFVLPELLSQNDGILLIESAGLVVIPAEAVKTSPKIGSVDKQFRNASISFNPGDPNADSLISIGFTSNTDLIAGSIIQLHLGGFTANQSTLNISGSISHGEWDAITQNLNLIVNDYTSIAAGTQIALSIRGFVLPNSLLPNDPSVYLQAEAVGIATPQRFITIPAINPSVTKGFSRSELWYGNNEVPYPGRVGNFSVRIQSTFALLSGAVVNVGLPGYISSVATISISTSPRSDIFVGNMGSWNGTVLALTIKNAIFANEMITISVGGDQFILPDELQQNDPSLTLSASGAQYLPIESIKTSTAIVPRQFTISTLTLDPSDPVSVSVLSIQLKASVAIEATDSIVITLPEFVRDTGNITLSNLVGGNCTAKWNQTEHTLTIQCDAEIFGNTDISFSIGLENNFVIPRSIALNSQGITIAVPRSIPVAPFRSSPLIGDGPNRHQQFCMYQFDVGVRVHVNNIALYPELSDCVSPSPCEATNWITDACSVSELSRCGCSSQIPDSPDTFTISGFNLRSDDQLEFVPTAGFGVQVVGTPTVTSQGGLSFPFVKALRTGQYSIFLKHSGTTFPVGTLTVRAACASPLVGYNGQCQTFCPYGYIPQYGDCLPFTNSKARIRQPTGFQIALTTDISGLAFLDSSDPTRQFYDYSFVENLKQVLNEPETSDRISVVGIRDAGPDFPARIIVAGAVSGPLTVTDRSAQELVALLSALLVDEYSVLYTNEFFSRTVRSFPLRKIDNVVYCESIGRYYVAGCPTNRDWGPPTGFATWYWLAIVIGGFVVGLVAAATALAFYRLDSADLRISGVFKRRPKKDASVTNDFSVFKIKSEAEEKELTLEMKDVTLLDHADKVEYAKTWLDGQLLDEPLILRRNKLRNGGSGN